MVYNDSPNDTHQDNRKDTDSYRGIELISGTTRRRRWSEDERARILAESFEPGANISAVARRHGVHGGLLHSSVANSTASKLRRGPRVDE
ncbi:transposase-like protein [Rhodoblastus sphagnicola]|nr:transposase-like protein [Rhodoblastus sphagnicola]